MSTSELVKDILKALDDFENRQQKSVYECFLIWKGIYILKVYSIHGTLRYNPNIKKISLQKMLSFFLSRSPTHHSFTFNLQFLCELKPKVLSLELCMGFSIFNSVSFLLNFIFLFNKKHGIFDFKTS